MARAQVRGYAIGALYMTGFGTAWALGAAGVAISSRPWVQGTIVGIVAIAIALLIPTVTLLRASRHLPDNSDPASHSEQKRTGRLYNLVFFGEGATIALTIIIANAINRSEYIAPVIALIVGVHFLPLASLFKVRLYYATGALMILISLTVMIIVSTTTIIDRQSAWIAIPMAGSAVVLWLTTIGVLLMGRAALCGTSGHAILHQ